jgi:transcription elongation factor S-II
MRVVSNPSEFRDNIRKQLTRLFNEEHQGNLSDSAIENIEKSIYNNSLQIADKRSIVKKWDNPFFVHIYVDKIRSIYFNLPEITRLLKEKKVKSHDVGAMTHQDMAPDKWKKLIEDKKIRDENKYAPKLEASTDNFTCRKCKSKECSYYQLQTRSADEPMTTFVTCLKCGNRWKC